jgi:hypothetical protein
VGEGGVMPAGKAVLERTSKKKAAKNLITTSPGPALRVFNLVSLLKLTGFSVFSPCPRNRILKGFMVILKWIP